MSDTRLEIANQTIERLRELVEHLEDEAEQLRGEFYDACRARLEAAAKARRADRAMLVVAEALDFADERADVKDGPGGGLVPDDWMRVAQMLRRALGREG